MSEDRNSVPNQEENISDVLERLKQSFGNDDKATSAVKEETLTYSENTLSEDELKEKLRLQFATDTEAQSTADSDFDKGSYEIDENFLEEAEASEDEEEIDIFKEDAIAEETEDIYEETEQAADEADTLDISENYDLTVKADMDLDNTSEDMYIDETVEEDSFEDIEAEENFEEEPVLDSAEMPSDDTEKDEIWNEEDIPEEPFYYDESDDTENIVNFIDDDDITFDDLEAFEETPSNSFVLTKLDIEEKDTENIRTIILDERLKQELAEQSAKEPQEPSLELVEDEEIMEEDITDDEIVEKLELTDEDDDFLSEFFENETDNEKENESTVLDACVARADDATFDASELSLLMQFGCNESDISKCITEKKNADEESEQTQNSYNQEQNDFEEDMLREKQEDIISRYDACNKNIQSAFLRLLISMGAALLLLIYELLPILGVNSGIMNRSEYIVPYILIGIAGTVLCLSPSYKQLWEGIKLFGVNKADGYSIVATLFAVNFIYDFTLFFVPQQDRTMYPVFHFALACVTVFAILMEWRSLNIEKKKFLYFLADIVEDPIESEEETTSFTLYLSKGKNSTAEKMYAGGLDRTSKIYSPVTIKRLEESIDTISAQSKKSRFSMYFIIPSIVISIVMLLVGIIASGGIWSGFCGMMLSLLLTLPIVSMFAVWMPFERMSAKGESIGYAFANEDSMNNYANADILTFKDTHLFTKVPSSNVNLVLYDATPNDVLLACLDKVYSSIGGPMKDTFNGCGKRFAKCKIIRVARNGIEAVVENNYSVLVGSEAFMQRFGISFPNVSLNNSEDRVFTLCVSINGRASARLAARYEASEMFEMFVKRLAEDGIACAVETYDPLICTELIKRVLPKNHTPFSIVHLNAQNIELESKENNDEFLFDIVDEDLELISNSSRFSLAVALTDAKRMKKIRKLVNILSVGLFAFGTVFTALAVAFDFSYIINEFLVFLLWGISFGGLMTVVGYNIPSNERFSFDAFVAEKEMEEIAKNIEFKDKERNKK